MGHRIGPFPIPAKRIGARYIITVVEYVTKWAEVEPVDTCSSDIVAKFIYENIITRFGCPLTLTNDQGSHFINKTIKALVSQFKIDHRHSIAYHPQSNGEIEAFNKTLTKGLTKICKTKTTGMKRYLQYYGRIEQHTSVEPTKHYFTLEEFWGLKWAS